MTRLPVRLTGLLAVFATLVACALSDDEQTAADTIESALVGKQAPASVEESAGCVAEAWVGEVGTDALREDGVLNGRDRARADVVREIAAGRQPVSDEVAEAYAEAWYHCADFDEISLDEEATDPDVSEDALDEYADCLKEIDDDLWKDAIVDRLTGDPESAANVALERERADCRGALGEQAG